MDAIDIDQTLDARPRRAHGAVAHRCARSSQVAAGRREAALAPFDDPKLRAVLIEAKRASEVVIDEVSRDVVISSRLIAREGRCR